MRLALAPLAAVLLLPVLPVTSASAEAPARVTAVVQHADGTLGFRTERVPNETAARARAAHLRQNPGVVAADVDRKVRLTGDPLQSDQWALATLRATDVWQRSDASGQVIGVVDSGVDAAHPDLSGIVRRGADFVAAGDGRTDPQGHGTHVAGIAAAVVGNGTGGAGLAKSASVLPVRVIAADGSGYDSDAAQGLVWAADNGATVVNLSFGGPDRSSVMDAAVKYVLGKGIPIVASAGNSGAEGDPVMWPAANPGVIAVGAVSSSGARPGWSSTGSHLAVSAPGVSILSTLPGAGYGYYSGTSMASPFVAAAAALLRRTEPSLTPAGIRERLTRTAVDLGPSGFDSGYGHGRIDVFRALGLTTPVPAPSPASVESAPSTPTAEPTPTSSPTPLEPTPTAESAPTAEPTPTSPAAEPTPTASAEPAASASPAPATQVAPAPSARISASRGSTPYRNPVTIAARTLADGTVVGGVPVRLERLVGASWVLTRTGTTGADGLTRWELRPDRTADYRVVGDGFVSPSVRVRVIPLVQASGRRTGIVGRILPGAATSVRLQQRTATGWVTRTTGYSRADGTFSIARRQSVGSVVRAVAFGVASPAVRVS